jgi:segregation and condensation protein A
MIDTLPHSSSMPDSALVLPPPLALSAGDAVPDETAGLPTVVDQVALARLYGEPLFAMPTDLYIPPDALEVFLEAFEGPLDLLLYLIRKQNFNILDIPMAGVTRQYLSYVEEIRQKNLELAAEYLLMAAMLIEIKSRMLLPPKKTQDGKMKLASQRLDALPVFGRDYLRAQVIIEQSLQTRFPDVHVLDLQEAWAAIMKRARLIQHHKITREELSVREHMSIVLKRLQGRKFVEFEDLFDPAKGLPVLVVTFIALLELAKETLIDITQAEVYAPIYVRLAFTQAA